MNPQFIVVGQCPPASTLARIAPFAGAAVGLISVMVAVRSIWIAVNGQRILLARARADDLQRHFFQPLLDRLTSLSSGVVGLIRDLDGEIESQQTIEARGESISRGIDTFRETVAPVKIELIRRLVVLGELELERTLIAHFDGLEDELVTHFLSKMPMGGAGAIVAPRIDAWIGAILQELSALGGVSRRNTQQKK